MSKEIDWSKAPEGATHARNCGWEHPDWYKIVDGVLMVHSCNEGWDESGYSDMGEVPNLQTRPAKAWTGTGLPPVGTVCECQNDAFKWLQGVIVHVGADRGKKIAIMQCENEMLWGESGEFRPISTHEQIAVEERKNAIDAMSAATQGAHNWIEAFGKLYDHGYRKTEAGK